MKSDFRRGKIDSELVKESADEVSKEYYSVSCWCANKLDCKKKGELPGGKERAENAFRHAYKGF